MSAAPARHELLLLMYIMALLQGLYVSTLETPVNIRACLIAITIACSRLRRSPDGGGGVENALRAFSTPPPPFFTRRSRACTRREMAKTLRIRHALKPGVQKWAKEAYIFL